MRSTDTMELNAIRRANLARVCAERKLTPTMLSELLGSRVSYWRDLLEDPNKSFGEKIARRIEEGLSLPDRWLDEFHRRGQSLAQQLSDPGRTVVAELLFWEELVETKVEGRFAVDLIDDAMAPEMKSGVRIEFLSLPPNKRPTFGRHVLIVDAEGIFHFRAYVQAPASEGGWVGRATGAGFMDVLPVRDGARVLAVMTHKYEPVVGELFRD